MCIARRSLCALFPAGFLLRGDTAGTGYRRVPQGAANEVGVVVRGPIPPWPPCQGRKPEQEVDVSRTMSQSHLTPLVRLRRSEWVPALSLTPALGSGYGGGGVESRHSGTPSTPTSPEHGARSSDAPMPWRRAAPVGLSLTPVPSLPPNYPLAQHKRVQAHSHPLDGTGRRACLAS